MDWLGVFYFASFSHEKNEMRRSGQKGRKPGRAERLGYTTGTRRLEDYKIDYDGGIVCVVTSLDGVSPT